jgi:hypothetical protein
VDPARRLRSGAWLLQRSWRRPHGLPAGWRSERFAAGVDSVRHQLAPIRTLASLADSYARESLHRSGPVLPATVEPRPGCAAPWRLADSSLEVAYAMRWIELDRGRALHDWRTLCERAP